MCQKEDESRKREGGRRAKVGKEERQRQKVKAKAKEEESEGGH